MDGLPGRVVGGGDAAFPPPGGDAVEPGGRVVPPPPPNQMIHVKMKEGVEARPGAPIWVYGEFKISKSRSQYGEVSFEIQGEGVEDYQ